MVHVYRTVNVQRQDLPEMCASASLMARRVPSTGPTADPCRRVDQGTGMNSAIHEGAAKLSSQFAGLHQIGACWPSAARICDRIVTVELAQCRPTYDAAMAGGVTCATEGERKLHAMCALSY